MGITLKEAGTIIDYRRWFLIPTVRILIVADSTIALDDTIGFSLGKVVDTLENETFYSHVRFLITGATRAGVQSINTSANSKQFTYQGFRFNMPGFNINDYDQVWFFGFDPGNDASPDDSHIDTISLSNPNPLNDPAEIAILSNWMDNNKGGVLAIGDHHYLGASLCSKIPRVRKMRRWTNADHVPSVSGPDRHDTNQDKFGTGIIPFDAQSDDVPQPIEVLKKTYFESIFKIKTIPHPVLCGVDGVIDIFPDHPHEGEVLGTLYSTNAGGTPVDVSQNYPNASAEFPDAVSGTNKPVPQIIALGHPVNNPRLEKNQPTNTLNPSHTNSSAAFGVANVYDGELAGVGRIVTDSTWHHWFNINLVGLDTPAAADKYRKIQNYHTNVAIWLCNDSLRHSILSSWIWVYLITEFDPMRFSIHDSIWRLGTNAKDALGRTASRCNGYEWIRIFIPALIHQFEIPKSSPCLTCPPIDVFEVAILGGVMRELLPKVEQYRINERFDRKKIDISEINKAVKKGIELGYHELLSTLKESIEHTSHLYKVAEKSLVRKEINLDIALNTKHLVIELESFTLVSPIFSAMLNEGRESFISVLISDNFGALNTEPVKIYLKENTPGLLNALSYKINQVIIESDFQDGESLFFEFFLNDNKYSPAKKIYTVSLQGPVNTWIGDHAPHLSEFNQQKPGAAAFIKVTEVSKY